MNRSQITELTISTLLLSITLGALVYFSTMQIEHGKQHTNYTQGAQQ